MSSGLEAPPVTVSTQQQRHTAKSLWRFEPWSRAPSVTCFPFINKWNVSARPRGSFCTCF